MYLYVIISGALRRYNRSKVFMKIINSKIKKKI